MSIINFLIHVINHLQHIKSVPNNLKKLHCQERPNQPMIDLFLNLYLLSFLLRSFNDYF